MAERFSLVKCSNFPSMINYFLLVIALIFSTPKPHFGQYVSKNFQTISTNVIKHIWIEKQVVLIKQLR